MAGPDLITGSARAIAERLPAVGLAEATLAVEEATGSARARKELHRALLGQSDALVSGTGDVPLSLVRLATILAAAGHGVKIPGCLHCGRIGCPLPGRAEGGRLCDGCKRKANAKPCARCGLIRPIQARTAGGGVCVACYDKPASACGRCGKIRPVSRLATADSPQLCASCYRGPVKTCSQCGRERPCTRRPDGLVACASCKTRTRPQRVCCRCRRTQPIFANWPIGPVCGACYAWIKHHPQTCHGCSRERPLIGEDGGGNQICGPCAGVDLTYQCRHCGQSGKPYARDRCARCVLKERVATLTDDGTGKIRTDLQPLADALTATDHPDSLVQWFTRKTARTLATLIAGGGPLNHASLDALPQKAQVHHLRALLISVGVLPDRHDHLERIVPWLDDLLATTPARLAATVRAYAVWDVLARARRLSHRQPVNSGTGGHLRAKIRKALDFLLWLDERGTPLAELSQNDIDEWLSAGVIARYQIAAFITWLRRRGQAPAIKVPKRPEISHCDAIAEEERWQQLRRCLHDDTIPLPLRAAGTLVLLYGHRVSRIVMLTAADLHETDDKHYLTLDQRPVLIPPLLADLITQLRDQDTRTALRATTPSEPWLFPGRRPGHHLDGRSLLTTLKRHGIETQRSRNAALLALAEQLPGSILADLLGLHPHTATRWITLAKRDWNDYIAARTAAITRNSATPE